MHAGRAHHCPRLRAIHTVLADGAEHSTLELSLAGETLAVSAAVSELRQNGADIVCRYAGKTASGARLYLYRMLRPAPEAAA